MEEFLSIAEKNLNCAWEIIKELDIAKSLAVSGCTANLVGSMSTGLLMSNLDIDFHVYSGSSDVMESFQAIGRIARNKRIKKVSYYSFMEEDDRSLDWHLHYLATDGREWRIDIIHLMTDSPYVGKAEAVAAKINAVMDAASRKTILRLKWEAANAKIACHGIEIYKAVLEENVTTLNDFLDWQKNNEGKDWWDIKTP